MTKPNSRFLFRWREALAGDPLDGPSYRQRKGAAGRLKPPIAPATLHHVGLALSIYMDNNGKSAFPGAERLARETKLHVITVRDALAELVERGWLVKVRDGGRPGIANAYEAALPVVLNYPSPVVLDNPSGSRDRVVGLSATASRVVDDNPISSRTSPSNSSSARVQAVLAAIVDFKVTNARDVRDADAYRRKIENEVEQHRERAQDLVAKFPDAPPDVIGAHVQGQPSSLKNYRRIEVSA